MLVSIEKVCGNFNARGKQEPYISLVLYWLLGKAIEGINKEKMDSIWLIAGYGVCDIYKQVLKARDGVG